MVFEYWMVDNRMGIFRVVQSPRCSFLKPAFENLPAKFSVPRVTRVKVVQLDADLQVPDMVSLGFGQIMTMQMMTTMMVVRSLMISIVSWAWSCPGHSCSFDFFWIFHIRYCSWILNHWRCWFFSCLFCQFIRDDFHYRPTHFIRQVCGICVDSDPDVQVGLWRNGSRRSRIDLGMHWRIDPDPVKSNIKVSEIM